MLGTCTLITGAPGTGKTLGWVRWLVNDYLCKPGGLVMTNIRLNPDKIGEYVSSNCNTFYNRHWGYAPSPDEVSGRIVMLGATEVSKLRNTSDIPSFFGDIENLYICIDEFHVYCNNMSSGICLKSWADWLATLRHHNCQFCAISQDVSQIDRVYKSRVEARIECLSANSQHDPYFRIPIGDWVALISAIRGETVRPVCRALYDKSVNGRWALRKKEWAMIDNSIFGLYDSYQKDGL